MSAARPPVPVLPKPQRFGTTLTGLQAQLGIPFGSSLGRPALRVHVLPLAGGTDLIRLEHSGQDVGFEDLDPSDREELMAHVAWHRENGGAS